MRVIHDAEANGPDNMARDVALLASLGEEVILRTYLWAGPWVSYGYFQSAEEASSHFPDVPAVRRPTGGGLVDHRCDFTYSLFFPKTHPFSRQERARSYALVHASLLPALREHGLRARLIEQEEGGGPACFAHPVPGDIVDEQGRKLAGAAQRRTRDGLLHQGSLLINAEPTSFRTSLERALHSI
ncbi:MAG: hypothetical protein Q7Q71_09925 [Verrucomicrobiota bacterium JB023]|nr:hypothetical protein [Verrucomicrobiota bacterium JB023]